MNKEAISKNQSKSLKWIGYAVFIWSIAYMIPHLYWALGWKTGLGLFIPTIANSPHFKLINYIASVFLTAAGFLGLAFIYLKKQIFSSTVLLGIALMGCALSTSHGIYGVMYRVFEIIGVVELPNIENSFVFWDLFLFEPWFLIEGVLLGALGWFYLDKQRSKKIWLVLCVVGVIIGLITGLMGVRFA